MDEDIKLLEEIVDIYYDCAGNKEQDYDMRVDMGFMKKEAQALENLIKGYRELEKRIISLTNLLCINDSDENYIPKSKIKEKIEELEEEIDKLADEAIKSILENNQGKFDLVNKSANNISMQIQALQELMEE